MSYHKINIGCGKTPTNGFINYDNSVSLKMIPFLKLVKLLNKLSVVNEEQLSFIEFCKKNKIYYSNAVKKIPLDSSSADVVYASHMLEHLDTDEVKKFLNEAKRVLIKGGIIRLVVPDLEKLIVQYNNDKLANKFMKKSLLYFVKPKTLVEKIKFFIVGARHHMWMYDKESLRNLLAENGFKKPAILNAGETLIKDPGELNLNEKEDESIFIEALA